MAAPIEDHALVGDTHVGDTHPAGLVRRDGSIDRLCPPRTANHLSEGPTPARARHRE